MPSNALIYDKSEEFQPSNYQEVYWHYLGGTIPDSALSLLKTIFNYPDSVNLPYLIRLYSRKENIDLNNDKEYRRIYQKIYRLAHLLEEKDLITLNKADDGLLWANATKSRIDLIKAYVKFQPTNVPKKSPFAIPNSFSKKKRDVALTLMSMKNEKQFDYQEINNQFHSYLRRINNTMILLESKYIEEEPDDQVIGMEYSTRFNDKNKQVYNLKKFEKIIDNATEYYRIGVHLTLTTDPKRHKSLWHANRHFGKAFNKFIQYLQSANYKNHPRYKSIKHQLANDLISKDQARSMRNRLRRECKPTYVCVYEFTKSGLLHAHILFFGTGYIAHKDDITEEWKRCNQGEINYVYKIQNKRGKWVWSGRKPKDAKEYKTASEYLKKYLKKGLWQAESCCMYWAINKRFFSNSGILFKSNKNKDKNEEPKESRYKYLGVISISELSYEEFKIVYSRKSPPDHTKPPPKPPPNTLNDGLPPLNQFN